MDTHTHTHTHACAHTYTHMHAQVYTPNRDVVGYNQVCTHTRKEGEFWDTVKYVHQQRREVVGQKKSRTNMQSRDVMGHNKVLTHTNREGNR